MSEQECGAGEEPGDEIECGPCSETGGAGRAVFHAPPACREVAPPLIVPPGQFNALPRVVDSVEEHDNGIRIERGHVATEGRPVIVADAPFPVQGKSVAAGSDKEEDAETAAKQALWSSVRSQLEEYRQSLADPGYAVAAWPDRSPRVVVLNGASPEDCAKLAVAVAVAQEVVMLLDAVDRRGLEALDLTGWSRLRAVSEAWWLTCGFTAAELDAWIAEAGGEAGILELAPEISAEAAPATGEEAPRRRLVNVVAGKASEIQRLYEELRAPAAPSAFILEPQPPPDGFVAYRGVKVEDVEILRDGYLTEEGRALACGGAPAFAPTLPAEPPPAFRALVADLIGREFGFEGEGQPYRKTVAALWAAAHGEKPGSEPAG